MRHFIGNASLSSSRRPRGNFSPSLASTTTSRSVSFVSWFHVCDTANNLWKSLRFCKHSRVQSSGSRGNRDPGGQTAYALETRPAADITEHVLLSTPTAKNSPNVPELRMKSAYYSGKRKSKTHRVVIFDNTLSSGASNKTRVAHLSVNGAQVPLTAPVCTQSTKRPKGLLRALLPSCLQQVEKKHISDTLTPHSQNNLTHNNSRVS